MKEKNREQKIEKVEKFINQNFIHLSSKKALYLRNPLDEPVPKMFPSKYLSVGRQCRTKTG